VERRKRAWRLSFGGHGCGDGHAGAQRHEITRATDLFAGGRSEEQRTWSLDAGCASSFRSIFLNTAFPPSLITPTVAAPWRSKLRLRNAAAMHFTATGCLGAGRSNPCCGSQLWIGSARTWRSRSTWLAVVTNDAKAIAASCCATPGCPAARSRRAVAVSSPLRPAGRSAQASVLDGQGFASIIKSWNAARFPWPAIPRGPHRSGRPRQLQCCGKAIDLAQPDCGRAGPLAVGCKYRLKRLCFYGAITCICG